MGMLALSPASSCSAGFLVQEKNACAKQLGSQTVGLRTGFSISTARPWTGCTTSLASIPKSETALRRARPREVLASLHPQPERAPPLPPRTQMLPRGAEAKCHTCRPHTLIHTLTHTYFTHSSTTHIALIHTLRHTSSSRRFPHSPYTPVHTCTHSYTHSFSHIANTPTHMQRPEWNPCLKLRPHPCSCKKQKSAQSG